MEDSLSALKYCIQVAGNGILALIGRTSIDEVKNNFLLININQGLIRKK